MAAAVYRRNSILHEWPILEVTGAAAVTAAVSYLVRTSMPIIESVIEILCFSRLFSSGEDIDPVHSNLSSSTI